MSFSHRLSDSLRRAFGEDAAEEFVGWMDEVESRRMDAVEFRETVRGDIAELRQELRDAEARLQTQIQSLRYDMLRWTYVVGTGVLLSIVVALVALIAMRRG